MEPRAVTKGGYNCLPKMTFPGGLLIGCDAGTLNFTKIKGVHTAMKSGLIAAETVVAALKEGKTGSEELHSFERNFLDSWLFKELYDARNFGPALHKFGSILGGAIAFVEQNILRGNLPFTLHDTTPDHLKLKPASRV